MSIKDMIARCIERMRSGACTTCENRRVCPAGSWQNMASLLDRNAAIAQPRGLRALLASVARSFTQSATPVPCFVREVEEALAPLLANREATASRVADRLGLSRQTLYRRLRAEGTSFDELHMTKRRQLAIRYLGVERMPVKVASWRLGFSSPAAFSRAFKRWTGTPPGRFRSQDVQSLG